MTCQRCGLVNCSGGCAPAPVSQAGSSKAERERQRRLERGDTLPDIEDDEEPEDEDGDLLDADALGDEITQVGRTGRL